MSETLYLLDGTLLFFRALFGTPDLFHDDSGRPVNGLRGYLTYLTNLLAGRADGGPMCHGAVAFDESLTTCWRNDHYPEYKANRPAADDATLQQLDLCRKLTAALGVPVLADLRYEADDFIATLARLSPRPVMIVSRDKDLGQLLSPTVSQLDPKDGRVATAESFIREFGFPPELFPDYQALMGDSVDNIPGVPGVGPKSAQRLIATFGDLDRLYADAADWSLAGVKPGSRMAQRLAEHRDAAFLFRRILRLDDRVPLPAGGPDTRLQPPSRESVTALLDGLGVRRGLGKTLVGALEGYGV